MTSGTDTKPRGGRRIVCELDPSLRADERICDALALCEEHGAELYVVWVVEPGGVGQPAVLGTAVDLASERGIRATSAARYGTHEIVLHEPTESRVGSFAFAGSAR
jgi:hypothetical protein